MEDTRGENRRSAFSCLGLLKLFAVSLPMIFLLTSCHFYPGRAAFDAKCLEDGGARIPQTLKADGYLDKRFRFMQAVKDLADGRIRFFEIHKSKHPHPPRGPVIIEDLSKYERFFIAESGSSLCQWYEADKSSDNFYFRSIIVSMLGYQRCLGRETAVHLKSPYEVNFEKSDTEPGGFFDVGWSKTTIIDRITGSTIATYNSYVHYDIMKFETTGIDAWCPPQDDSFNDPYGSNTHGRLTEAVFQDSDGRVVDLNVLIKYSNPKKLLVPTNIEVHKVKIHRGRPRSHQGRPLSDIDVIVTFAERPVLLVLEADTEVVWWVMVARGASVPVIVTTGSAPQTVVGGWGQGGSAPPIYFGSSASKTANSRSLPSELETVFNSTPRSIQEYSEAPEIVVDGITRVKPQ